MFAERNGLIKLPGNKSLKEDDVKIEPYYRHSFNSDEPICVND